MFQPTTIARVKPARLAALTASLLALGLTAAGCDSSGAPAASAKVLVVATHSSWAMPQSVLNQFTKQTGYTVRIEEQGDAGELTNKLVLTKGTPIADVVYGIDNTFASRAADAGILTNYQATNEPASAQRFSADGLAGKQLSPVDFGDVCVNVDDSWYAKHHQTPPRTLDDLTKPAYKGQFVTPAATTSSPGMAFLVATIAAKGKAWPAYWKALMANGTMVVPGWTEAWQGNYTAGGGSGTRPIVLSYASSPPDTIAKGATRPSTSALLDTCFQQVEYAGVLAGTKHAAIARQFVDFLVSKAVQQQIPGQMYMYPVNPQATLPSDWQKWAKNSTHPYTMAASTITADRSAWLAQWRTIVSQ